MSDLLAGPGHLLPRTFGGGSAHAQRSRGVPRRMLWMIGCGVALLVIGIGIQLWGNLDYDRARAEFSATSGDTLRSQNELSTKIDALRIDADAATTIAATDTGVLMPADRRAALDAAIEPLAGVIDTAADIAGAPAISIGAKPGWAWELFPATARLNEQTEQLRVRGDDAWSAIANVTTSEVAIDETSVAAVQAAAENTEAFEAAHVNARNPEIIALRAAAEAIEQEDAVLSADTADRFTILERAAAAVLDTESAELAEKDGPLRDKRTEIEAFARELAPGVLLDFDWSATVPGYDRPSYGGWTQWWYADSGYATIALSNNVAEQWPADWTKALVAHEVGHAISVKCPTAYDSSDQDLIEEWATAWAIGKGFTDSSGNGVEVYRQPSQAMLDAAAQCR